MGVRVWGPVEDRLIEIRVEPVGAAGGLLIEGLPDDRARSTRDRVRAALVNQDLMHDLPPLVLRLEPLALGPATCDLDLPIALALLVRAGVIDSDVRWIFATGRLGLDGSVFAPEVPERTTLGDVVDSLCRTPGVESERMLEGEET